MDFSASNAASGIHRNFSLNCVLAMRRSREFLDSSLVFDDDFKGTKPPTTREVRLSTRFRASLNKMMIAHLKLTQR